VLGIEGSVTFPFDSDDFGADTLGSLRGRLGYAVGKTLVYATGGVAFLDSEDADETQTGWVAGAGIEHKIRDNISLGLEGLYYSFEDDYDGIAFRDRVIVSPVEVERDFWTIQARLTYHLGADRYNEALK
jgi:outer membrane immunogenic protein